MELKRNILDIKGIKVGQAENPTAKTGVSVVLAEDGAICGVDVRGAGPGTRETDLLNPINTVEKVHAVVLSGGSAFGLEAASGVMNWLEKRGIGFDVGVTSVPIVPSAVLFDLEYGDAFVRPDKEMGMQACENASDSVLLEGGLRRRLRRNGRQAARHGALHKQRHRLMERGNAKRDSCGSADCPVNAIGDVYENGSIIAGTRADDGSFTSTEEGFLQMASNFSISGKNTTIGVVATNVKLTKAQATKVAGMAHDGLARCIRPIHTSLDGDTIFCLSTGELEFPENPVDTVGILAARVAEQAIIRAVKAAK